MPLYRVSFWQLKYKDRKYIKKEFINAFYIGEMKFRRHGNNLFRYGRKEGILPSNAAEPGNRLCVEVEEYTIQSLIDLRGAFVRYLRFWEPVFIEDE